jgi:choline monooxygenase
MLDKTTGAGALAAEDIDLSRVTEDPAQSWTLPAKAYYSPEVWELEKENILFKSWIFVGPASELLEEGAYTTLTIGDQNIAVVRGKDGALRAFYNVCAHRAHELLSGQGRVRAITCPYHAWVFELDGRLRPNPAVKKTPGFEVSSVCLTGVQVEEFCGFAFVNLDPQARPMAEVYPGFEAEFRAHFPDPSTLVLARRDHYDITSNWKAVVENFLECYHCPPAHRAFAQLCDMDSWSTEPHERHVTFTAPVRSSENSAYKVDESKSDEARSYFGMYLWPSVAFNVFPGEPNITIYNFMSAGPERTREHLDYYLPTTEISQEMKAAADYIHNVLQPEDIAIVESIQRGFHSKGYTQGRLVYSTDPARPWEREHGVHRFARLVREALEG